MGRRVSQKRTSFWYVETSAACGTAMNGTMDWLEGRPFTTTFVTGNHKNYEYSLEEWRGGSIRRIRPSVILLERGNHLSWWKEELSSEEEYQTARASLDRVGWEVDYILKL